MRKLSTSRTTIRLALEYLESRLALAGNIVASLVGDTLHLTGDRLDNDAIITLYDGTVSVGSIRNTTINGATGLSLTVDPARLNLIVDGLAGNDHIWVNVGTTAMNTNISVRGGDGNDNLAVVAAADGILLGSAMIDAGKGDDVIEFGVSATGNVSISGGTGADQVTLRAIAIAGDLLLTTGDGNDRVTIANGAECSGRVTLDGGRNRDTITVPLSLAADAVFAGFEDIKLL